jgi:hypothetical protein
MKKWKQLLVVFGIIAGVGAVALPAQTSYAINVFNQCSGNSSSAVCKSTGDSFNTMIKTVINILLYVLGMVAVIMIVIGGIRYTTSNGDAGAVKSAKDTILYSVIGLVVAIMAYSIVNFVVSWF